LSNATAVLAEGAKHFLRLQGMEILRPLQTSLRTQSAHIHSRHRDGRTGFIVAVASGQVDAVKMLLVRTYEAGLLDAYGDSRYDRKSALMWASKLGIYQSQFSSSWTSLLALR